MPYGKYRACSDEEILVYIKNGDLLAMDYLLEKYKYMVRKKAKVLFLMGGDREDLIQEGMIGLYKAIRDFEEEKESKFSTFAELCISRQIYSAIKTSNRKKNLPLNTYVSFYAPVNGEKEEAHPLAMIDRIKTEYNSNPEEMVIDKERTNMIEYEIEQRLSSFEREVIRLHIAGMKYTEIAGILQRNPKSIDNALQRIKNKISVIKKEVGE